MSSLRLAIEVQTNHFDRQLSHQEESLIAQKLFINVIEILKKRGLEKQLEISATWKRGCIVELIELVVKQIDNFATPITAAGAYILIKDYSDLRSSALLILEDIEKILFAFKDLVVRVVRAVIRDGRTRPFRKRIEPKFEEFGNSEDLDNNNDEIS